MYTLEDIRNTDSEVAEAIVKEFNRQSEHIELIASENWVSPAVMSAMGSVLTNKYAEGYPGKRYYGGCAEVDVIEELAINRAKELFGAEYVNVQPHSGAQANMAVQFAVLKPGDTVMGMNLDHGGHLTHGSKANFSGTYFNIVPYGVNDNGFIDYDEVERIAVECKPKMIIAGASAYCRKIDFKRFREICDKVGAVLFVDIRGFTTMSEVLEPEQVVEILNEYLSLTTKAIFDNSGTLDKFVGDAAMAVFNAPFDLEDYEFKAVCAAMDIVEGGKALEKSLMEKYGRTIGFGVGVNVGPAVVGNIGCDFRMDYTAIGDTVNTSARLEANAKKGQVLISDVLYDRIKDRIEVNDIGEIPLKGKSKGVFVYEVTEVHRTDA